MILATGGDAWVPVKGATPADEMTRVKWCAYDVLCAGTAGLRVHSMPDGDRATGTRVAIDLASPVC